ncbi:MAG TPA: hypothetical protein VGG72_03790 [Bryobacteraceae bacterium]|jgi:hypothetical protein
MENETITIPTFDDALRLISGRASLAEASALTELLQVSSVAYGQSYRRQKHRELKEAESAVEHTSRLKTKHEGLLADAQKLVASLPGGGWVVGVVQIAGFGTCFGAEVVFNLAILPWILGVPSRSFLGMALAIAPATAPVILDKILSHLLGVGDLVDTLPSGLIGYLRSVSRVAFLAVAALVTLYSVWALGAARGVAGTIMNDPNATGMDGAQQHVVNLALLLVSLVLTVNGALFYLFGVHDLRRAAAMVRARAEVARLQGELTEIDSRLVKAVPVLEAGRRGWEQIEELEKSVVDAFFTNGKFRLEQVMARPVPVQPAHVRVKEILAGRLGPGRAA